MATSSSAGGNRSRGVGIELGDLAGFQDEVELAESQS